ncbi:hypothetical protein X739_00560 [Mesorhizobium sp. LNHC220B00]|nr:hypothetical protein [Mesorhizobium sp. LNHC220B00]ESY88339.1 hypothetical protein X739_00560 [Mesorhizobium sp. LNHC220B00]
MNDLYSGLNVTRAIPAVAVGTTGTGQTGKIIDRKGYIGPVLFDISYGAITATNAVFSVTVKEGDVTGTLTSVADADLIGTESAAGIAAGTPRTSNANKLVAKKIAYKGGKRYVQCNVKSTVTAATPIAVNAIQLASSQPAT